MSVQYQIKGHHVEVTEALHDYAIKKVSKIESRFDKITNVNIILRVESHEQLAEAEVNLAGGRGNIFAKATTADMYKSIDELSDKLLTQIKKYHDKLKDHDD